MAKLVVSVASHHGTGAVGFRHDVAARVVQISRHQPTVHLPADTLAGRVHQVSDRLPVRQADVAEAAEVVERVSGNTFAVGYPVQVAVGSPRVRRLAPSHELVVGVVRGEGAAGGSAQGRTVAGGVVAVGLDSTAVDRDVGEQVGRVVVVACRRRALGPGFDHRCDPAQNVTAVAQVQDRAALDRGSHPHEPVVGVVLVGGVDCAELGPGY